MNKNSDNTDNSKFKLSVSKTKTFLSCKAKYKFNYIEKLPKKKWDHFDFGNLLHGTLEAFHLSYINGSTKSFNEEMKIAYKEICPKYTLSKELKKEAIDILRKYLILLKTDSILSQPVISCEKPFSLQLSDDLIIIGSIDRVQKDSDGILHIMDYKTSKHKKYLMEDSFQLLVYALALFEEDPNLHELRASYVMLKFNFEFITFKMCREKVMKVKDLILKYYNDIIKEIEFKPTVGPLCKFCDYLDNCDPGKKFVFRKTFSGEVNW